MEVPMTECSELSILPDHMWWTYSVLCSCSVQVAVLNICWWQIILDHFEDLNRFVGCSVDPSGVVLTCTVYAALLVIVV